MRNDQFRSLWNLFDAMTVPAFRGPLTRVSHSVKEMTGLWLHPATWQTLALLALVGAGYWLYVLIRGARA